MSLIIDCHGHYTVLPKGHDTWREEQKTAFKAGTPCPPYPDISDAEIRETIEANQLRLIKERGADLTIFSPRASAMAPHVEHRHLKSVCQPRPEVGIAVHRHAVAMAAHHAHLGIGGPEDAYRNRDAIGHDGVYPPAL